MRSRPGWIEPEIFFRIVHAAQNGHNGAPVASYREQTVEIALASSGPNGAFETGNSGALTRRGVELLRKANEWQALLESGNVASQADIARRDRITRARSLRSLASFGWPRRSGNR